MTEQTDKEMKRVNVIIPTKYHKEVSKRGLKLSAVVREALEDQLNPNTITLSVTKKTHEIYMELFNEQQCSDKDFEPFLKAALDKYIQYVIEQKTKDLDKLKKKLAP